MAGVAALVLAGAFGLLGPRTSTVEASGGGYDLTVEHASITRAGQPAPMHVRIESADGFAGPVQVSVCEGLFDHFDFQNWYPNPSAETASPGLVLYEFDPPSGSVLDVSLDARTAPGQLGGREACRIAVLKDDEPAVSVAFTTWVLP
ncbi:malate dehydrogenase [Janibacter sp. HTCC2649]|nr:malate dehydrogenase [Janibacter sp. HTCC2649]